MFNNIRVDIMVTAGCNFLIFVQRFLFEMVNNSAKYLESEILNPSLHFYKQ